MRNVTVPIFSPLPGFPGRIRLAAVLLGLALTLGGCATIPPPDDSMNEAQTQLQAARDAGAADYAPVDLGFAQDKFQQAQAAMNERKYADAATLSEESRADAELARAKAKLGAARAQIQSKVRENSRLRTEGEQAAAEATRQEQQAAPAPSSSSAPTESAPADSAPTEDMPAPSASVLSAPPAGNGFQTLPTNNPPSGSSQQTDSDAQGTQR
jgi:PBP1b-binding outer membrane lipoprotein LpoB